MSPKLFFAATLAIIMTSCGEQSTGSFSVRAPAFVNKRNAPYQTTQHDQALRRAQDSAEKAQETRDYVPVSP
jgi:hypothetical protein